jgi:hypothetical protein
MENSITLSNWNGDGSGTMYIWKKEEKKVYCEYLKDLHQLKVTYYEDDNMEFDKEERLHINDKPNVFIMRKTSERIINQFMKN